MSYDLYLNKYADKFAILGGICIQTTLGFGDYDRLEKEIRRVFGLLKGKRWICCTTHFVQDHCSLDELEFAYDLITKLAREEQDKIAPWRGAILLYGEVLSKWKIIEPIAFSAGRLLLPRALGAFSVGGRFTPHERTWD